MKTKIKKWKLYLIGLFLFGMVAIGLSFSISTKVQAEELNPAEQIELEERPLLSSLSEEECLSFISDCGVEIPEEFQNVSVLGSFVKDTIVAVEQDPDVTFAYNYSVTYLLAENIKAEVKEYYSIEPSLVRTDLQSTEGLQDSILWSNTGFLKYNCYAYAIGRDENPHEYPTDKQYQPGDFSGLSFNLNMSISEMTQVVKADLEELGFVDIMITPSRPTVNSSTKLICMRKGATDYHFMRYDYATNAWYHKPGNTAILKYKYQPAYARIWTNESIDSQGNFLPATTTYDSDIYYITYSDERAAIASLFAGGSGMRHDPYLVSNAEQFRNIRHAYRVESVPYTGPEKQIYFSFKLTNNITLTEDWEPFEYPLTGLLDGNGHYVTYNMTLTQSEVAANTYFGLFRMIKGTGQVQNLELRNCSITSDTGTVLNAGENKIVGLGILAGSIYGAMEHSAVRVTNPVINCNISHAIVGGIGGSINSTRVTNCVVSGGTLTNYNGALGGMAGYGDIVYFSGGSCSTTLTKENYEDTDQIGEVVGNSTSTSTVSCSVTINRNGKCISEGTLITLADGTQVPVEELDGDELLLVWDFERGQFGAAPIVFIDSDPERAYRVIELTFSDGTKVEVISEHGFWDRTLNKYVYLDENAAQYIGHWFDKRAADAEGDFSGGYVQLTAVMVTEKVTVAYSPVTQGHLCYFVNGMLSMPGGIEGIFNIFEVDPETMAYDAEAFAEDIEEYGLYTYEEFAQEYPISEEAFEAFGCKYFKVALGKGVVTEARLVQLMNRYAEYLL